MCVESGPHESKCAGPELSLLDLGWKKSKNETRLKLNSLSNEHKFDMFRRSEEKVNYLVKGI